VTTFASATPPGATLTSVLQDSNGSYQELPVGETVEVGTVSVQVVQTEAPVVQFQIDNQSWLWLGDLNQSEQNQLVNLKQLPGQTDNEPLQVLWWSGKPLTPYLLMALKPEVAIATSENIDEETAAILSKGNTEFTPLRGMGPCAGLLIWASLR
jgi:competence protein ComEC